MVSSKYIGHIALFITVLALALTLGAIFYAGGTDNTVKLEYEDKLFDTSDIISLNIIMDKDKWDEMIENAINEEYYSCDVEINGSRFNNVGIRPKGNTSLSSIVNDPDTDRYSLKIEFGHFVKGQTCWGLDKLILNNNYADATNMKEALTYDMFKYLGADASLYNYADISVNGEYWGIYLALEGVEDSFLMRNYGAQSGELYKPDPMSNNNENGGRPDFKNGEKPDFEGMPNGERPDFENMPNGERPDFENGERPDFGDMPNGEVTPDQNGQPETGAPDQGENRGGRPGGMSGNGADLNYTDDELDSYSSIWEASVYDVGEKAERRVVTALKNISEGNSLEKYMDVDNLLKYMAVHSFVVNEDSLSGNMSHNYYLYESGGKLNIIPWDYNLAFGGMGNMGGGRGGFGNRNNDNAQKEEQGGRRNTNSADSMINDPIDTPFDGTHFFDTLLENEEYLAKYHEYYQKLVDEYIDGGELDKVYNRIISQIGEKIKTDPTAFYTYDEFTAAHEMLYKTIKLRAESVKGQLNGSIPAAKDGQSDTSAFIDASEIDTSVMGSMHNDDKGMGEGGNEDRRNRRGGGMQPGGMAPQKSEAEQSMTQSKNRAAFLISGAVMAAAVVFAGLFKRKRK